MNGECVLWYITVDNIAEVCVNRLIRARDCLSLSCQVFHKFPVSAFGEVSFSVTKPSVYGETQYLEQRWGLYIDNKVSLNPLFKYSHGKYPQEIGFCSP